MNELKEFDKKKHEFL